REVSPAEWARNELRSLPPEQLRARIEGVRVLVVDDDEATREAMRRNLEDFGATVVTAASADEARGAIARHHPTVMLSDIGMPGEDGYQLMRSVRALDQKQ